METPLLERFYLTAPPWYSKDEGQLDTSSELREAISIKRFVYKALLTTIVVLGIVGFATMPQVSKGSSNYLQKGMVSARFRGNDFYMVIGEVDLYHYKLFGNLKPTGQTVAIATAVQADKDTGETLRIATMQAKDSDGMTVVGGGDYALADLHGGISVIDIQPYPRWLDAIQAMRNAITELDTYTQFPGSDQSGPVVVAVSPGWWWCGWRGYLGAPGQERPLDSAATACLQDVP